MKTLDKILSELFDNVQLNDCIKKFVPQKYRDDFKQDLFELLLKKEESVVKAESNGELLFYVSRVIIYMTMPEGVLNRHYIRKEFAELKSVPCEVCEPMTVRIMKEIREDQVIQRIENSEQDLDTPYYRMLAEALKIHGTAGKVAKATGIPKSSVQTGIKKLRKYLQNE